jgi:hypothetical protein
MEHVPTTACSMPNNIDKIVDGFPHLMIALIIGIPTYKWIAELNLQLNANAASMQSNLGDGQLGLLALVISPSISNTLSAIMFVPPANPETTPIIPAGETVAQTATIVRQHTTDVNLFQEYLATGNALNNKSSVVSTACTTKCSVTTSQALQTSPHIKCSHICTQHMAA